MLRSLTSYNKLGSHARCLRPGSARRFDFSTNQNQRITKPVSDKLLFPTVKARSSLPSWESNAGKHAEKLAVRSTSTEKLPSWSARPPRALLADATQCARSHQRTICKSWLDLRNALAVYDIHRFCLFCGISVSPSTVSA